MELNPELLFKRMTRGALTGPAAEENTTMSRCKGKLETGDRCTIHAAPGKDLCTGCTARGAEMYDKIAVAPLRSHDLDAGKKRGRPAKKGAVPDHVAELEQHAANPVKAFSETQSDLDALAEQSTTTVHFHPGVGDSHACGMSVFTEASATDWDAVTCENCLLRKQLAELGQVWTDSTESVWARNDEMAQAMLGLIGCTVSLELLADQPDDQIRAAMDYAGACHLQASDNDDVEIPPMPFFLKGTQAYMPERQISPAALAPPQEHPQVTAGKRTPLGRLLRWAQPVIPSTAIVLDFDIYQLSAIQESELTREDLKEVILMLIEGQLGKIVEVDDPLAKSRCHAAG